MPSRKKRPFCEATRRRNIQGALWQNFNGSDGTPFYVPSVTRSYKDERDNWQNEILHVPLDDIPKVIAVLQELEAKAYQQMQADYQSRNADESPEEEQALVGAGAGDEEEREFLISKVYALVAHSR